MTSQTQVHDTHCPLCKTELNKGAVACHGCGAVLTTRGQVEEHGFVGGLAILFFIGGWLLLGPGQFILPFIDGEIELSRFAVGAIVTPVGFLILRRYFRRLMEPVWVRM